ncbi:glycoside hydrolase family 43 protein [Alkalibacterium indicireducens]|uniref:Glycoside hydrolase family 43 protein n=1 Tax=Alkalibacterium indicireducens TaxID=398758 RepID=A0ABP3KY13_9LACT
MQKFNNPIIEGFAPDPSVCAVGDDFYLVTSTFAYFPGVPIYHSKDLVNWKQIGNVLDRKEQLNLIGAAHSQGIFAPSIRYHDGTFYMITTNVTNGGNFLVKTDDPAGDWSDPYFIDNAPGIDPSLFFDEDGRCYYVGTRENPRGATYNGDWEVWLQELDLETMSLVGVSTKLWKGALRDAIWPEGPHIYKKDGLYYLMIAEGGTGFNHAITIARSESIDGPYIGNKNNPILTHRHLGNQYPIHNVGHGDLVEASNGEWFITLLASRQFNGYDNLGRETFLARVQWEDGWPVINPGEGRLLNTQEHGLPLVPVKTQEAFDLTKEDSAFVHLRNPNWDNYDRESREGWLRLYPSTVTIQEIDTPTYIGLRQSTMDYTLSVEMDEALKEGEEAGLVVLQNDQYSIRLIVSYLDGVKTVRFVSLIDGEETVVGSKEITDSSLQLSLTGEGQTVSASAVINDETVVIAENVDIHYLSTKVAGGFVGCTMGIYAVTDREDRGHADFTSLTLVKH